MSEEILAVPSAQNATSEDELRRERRDVFVECLSDYERARGYLILRYGDNSTNDEIAHWLAENGYGLIVEGVPEADAWRDRYWPDPRYPDNQGQRLTDEEVDDLVRGEYEEALADGEPWAEQAHVSRRIHQPKGKRNG